MEILILIKIIYLILSKNKNLSLNKDIKKKKPLKWLYLKGFFFLISLFNERKPLKWLYLYIIKTE